MPSVLCDIRLAMTATALSLVLLTTGCGGVKDSGNTTEVQMKDLETVDGTINDAMTDLDGVQSEGTAMAETGSNSGTSAAPAGNTAKEAGESPASDTETEVVADQ